LAIVVHEMDKLGASAQNLTKGIVKLERPGPQKGIKRRKVDATFDCVVGVIEDSVS
jgi:hypothetical protein